ncbi:MAG: aminodeoxychorismate/anthranilate synthase component II [Myxococcales bacterium]|nr:aminodeoxychorismate/anthranilate synthase component II [Myxococcales bacterium]
MIVVVDNYDSFTFNLVQLLRVVAPEGLDLRVVYADRVDLATLLGWGPSHVVLSPGPGDPSRAALSCALLRAVTVPTLGVCLGHQCLAAVSGATVRRGATPVHGKQSVITHDGRGLFAGLSGPMKVARYHSLVVDPQTVSEPLCVTALSDDGVVMGLRHRGRPLEGVQFHPESVLTEGGEALIANFLAM